MTTYRITIDTSSQTHEHGDGKATYSVDYVTSKLSELFGEKGPSGHSGERRGHGKRDHGDGNENTIQFHSGSHNDTSSGYISILYEKEQSLKEIRALLEENLPGGR